MKFDINADLGEGFGRWKMGDDDALMKIVTSANIACGYHAGDAVIMNRMVGLAQVRAIAIGAHIGLPDRLGFGRVPMQMAPSDLTSHAIYQLGALAAIARVNGYKVTHANFHGAFAKGVPGAAEMVVQAMAAFDPELVLASNPASKAFKAAQAVGLRTVGKVLIDRGYDDEGQLIDRKHPKAVLTDIDAIRERVSQFAHDGTVETVTGGRIKLNARCILVHSDTHGAADIALAVRDVLLQGGAQIIGLTELAE